METGPREAQRRGRGGGGMARLGPQEGRAGYGGQGAAGGAAGEGAGGYQQETQVDSTVCSVLLL